jgi:hypothetical protein
MACYGDSFTFFTFMSRNRVRNQRKSTDDVILMIATDSFSSRTDVSIAVEDRTLKRSAEIVTNLFNYKGKKVSWSTGNGN